MSDNEDRYKWENIVSVSEVMSPAVELFKKREEEATEFGKKLDQFLVGKSQKCPFHNVSLPIDRDRSFGESWYDRGLGKMKVFYGKCPACEEEERQVFVNERLMRCGVPKNMLHCTLDNYETENHPGKKAALDKVREQVASKKGFLILRGNVGNGKSHLAVATMKVFGGIMITEADLIGELRQSYTDHSGPDDLVEKYRFVKCLVIDELDINNKGTDIPGLLYRIVADRYNNGLLTVITSNDSLTQIKEKMGEKLVDRMNEGYSVAHFDWESHRHEN